MTSSSTPFVVAALYKFAILENREEIQADLLRIGTEHGVKGTLLLAHEGINGTIAGTRDGIDQIAAYLRSIPALDGMSYKESSASEMPFNRFKIKLKKEIVTIGIPEVSPTKVVGTYLSPQEWNAVIQDPEVVVLDTRNDYEVRIGTFKNAIDPRTKTFREFPTYVRDHYDPKKHKKVAMFCTGGIRCEKASSFMLEEGFETVYHLDGGILKYLETIAPEESLWEGECFVFDQRVSVKHGLAEGDYDLCYGCREPLSAADKASPNYAEGVYCPHCYDKMDDRHKKRVHDRHHQIQLAKKRAEKEDKKRIIV